MTLMIPVTPETIAAADRRIDAHIRRTPIIDLAAGAFGVDAAMSLKLEMLQHAGSFKSRGAFNTLTAMTPPPAGVAAASGGNHGAAVAYAAGRLGVKARIFVPEISSPAKVARIRDFGAEVVCEGARYADALANCQAYERESGAFGIHAYDAWPTIEGQGTTALEWERQAGALDTILVATGGGGLVSGIALWFQRRVRVVAVEPEGSCALHAALAAGRSVDVSVESIAADSLGARSVGDRVHAACAAHLDRVVLVPDDAIRLAMRHLWSDLRLATEPGGAAALAALLCGAYRPSKGERIGVLVCGANVDLAQFGTMTR
jgi:threonine dehydratase